MKKYFLQKNSGFTRTPKLVSRFTRLVDFGDAILSRTKSASPKLTTGFTLVETLVAISIFTISILGLMSVLTQGIAETSYAKQKIVATYLAQEGIEYIRNMRDTYVLYPGSSQDWNHFGTEFNKCNNPSKRCGFNTVFPHNVSICDSSDDCKLYVNNGSYSIDHSSGTDSGFVRKIWMDQVSSDEVRIFSEVSWTQGSGNKSITFSENLFNWVE